MNESVPRSIRLMRRTLLIGMGLLVAVSGCKKHSEKLGRSPEAEAKRFQFADPNMHISLVAAEPDIISPVDMAWAPNGDLFVAEMPGYPITEQTGRIKRLTDPDGDGRYHLASVFAEDLNFPNSIMPYDGGILVTDAPDIYFLKDTNGDGVADRKEVILTGFRPGNEQLRANDLNWGLDNWIYGANGRSGGSVQFATGTKEVSIDSRDFRFRLNKNQFEAISGLSQYGLAHDNWGNRFTSYNHRFARQVMLEERHLVRNPSLAIHAVFDTEQNKHDRRVYTLLESAARFNRDPIGYFTSLSGLTGYRGHLLGPEYTGDLFAGESVQAAVIRRRMRPVGPALVGVDVESETEFLAAPDEWFHPVNFTNGPDGALYLVDFYRKFVEHPEWAHADKKIGVDWRMGENHGRIWRITHKDAKWDASRMKPDLDKATSQLLVQQLADSAGWRRMMAQQLLVRGNRQDAKPYLEALLSSPKALARLHTHWTLEGLGLIEDSHILDALNDNNQRIKVQGIRLAESRLGASENLTRKVGELVNSPRLLVRFQAILALGDIQTPVIQQKMIAAAAQYPDEWTRISLLSSTADWAPDFAEALLVSSPFAQTSDPDDLEFLRQIGSRVAVVADRDQQNQVKRMTRGTPDIGELAFVAGYMEGRMGIGKPLPDIGKHFFKAAISLARKEDNPTVASIGIELLRYADAKQLGDDLLSLVWELSQDELQIAALQTVAAMNQLTLSAALFDNLNALNPSVRKALVASSMGSDAAASSLLSAIEAEQIEATEIPEELRYALLKHTDVVLKTRADEILGGAVDADRQAVIDRYLTALDGQTVDMTLGASIFDQNCSACHAIRGVGGRLAPDLTHIGSRSDEVLLVSILDPSRMVSYELRLTVVITKSGEVYSGTVSAETINSVTILQPDGKEHTILRENIQNKTVTSQSIMPEGFERAIDEAEMASLIGYLREQGG